MENGRFGFPTPSASKNGYQLGPIYAACLILRISSEIVSDGLPSTISASENSEGRRVLFPVAVDFAASRSWRIAVPPPPSRSVPTRLAYLAA